MSNDSLPPPRAEAEGDAKRPWSKPLLRIVDFSLIGIKGGNEVGTTEGTGTPPYTPHLS